jgi:monofunctional glycosyltransferase
MNPPRYRPLLRWLLLVLIAGVGLQVFFLARIAVMARVAPESTAFERSEAWRIANTKDRLRWRQDWVPYEQISNNLKRAVIASEDDIFVQHDGVQWEAIEKAWAKNAKAELQASWSVAPPSHNSWRRIYFFRASAPSSAKAKNLS